MKSDRRRWIGHRTVRILTAGAIVAVMAFAVSCNKLGVSPSGGVTVWVSGSLFNAGWQNTIIRADLLLDGKVINTVSLSPAGSSATLVGYKDSVKKGRHTVAFRITNQTISPTSYQTLAVTVETIDARFELEGATRLLATGESISYPVDL